MTHPSAKTFRTAARAALPLALLAILFAGSGCTKRVADLTVISSKNVDLYPLNLDLASPNRNIRGVDGRWWFLFIPFGGAPIMEEALENALAIGNGDLMTSAKIYERSWSVFILSYGGIFVEGDVWNTLDRRVPVAPQAPVGGFKPRR
jgi:hypothetical protein